MKKSALEYYKKCGLSERQIRVMEYVNIHGSITVKEYSQIVTEVKEKTLRDYLNDIVKKGLLKKVADKY